MSLKGYGRLGRDVKVSVLQQLQSAYFFSNSTEDVFSVQVAWHTLSTLPTRVSGRFSVSPLIRNPGRAEQLCGVEPWEPLPVPSSFGKVILFIHVYIM